MNSNSHTADDHALESRLGTLLASALNPGLDTLGHDVGERLRFAREQALGRAREQRLALPAGGMPVSVSASGTATWGGFAPWWQRAAALLPLLVLVAGLVLIDNRTTREQILVAADIDSQLLSDQLPPAAYADPGFAEYLRSSPPP